MEREESLRSFEEWLRWNLRSMVWLVFSFQLQPRFEQFHSSNDRWLVGFSNSCVRKQVGARQALRRVAWQIPQRIDQLGLHGIFSEFKVRSFVLLADLAWEAANDVRTASIWAVDRLYDDRPVSSIRAADAAIDGVRWTGLLRRSLVSQRVRRTLLILEILKGRRHIPLLIELLRLQFILRFISFVGPVVGLVWVGVFIVWLFLVIVWIQFGEVRLLQSVVLAIFWHFIILQPDLRWKRLFYRSMWFWLICTRLRIVLLAQEFKGLILLVEISTGHSMRLDLLVWWEWFLVLFHAPLQQLVSMLDFERTPPGQRSESFLFSGDLFRLLACDYLQSVVLARVDFHFELDALHDELFKARSVLGDILLNWLDFIDRNSLLEQSLNVNHFFQGLDFALDDLKQPFYESKGCSSHWIQHGPDDYIVEGRPIIL